jgi:hypothetical protein
MHIETFLPNVPDIRKPQAHADETPSIKAASVTKIFSLLVSPVCDVFFENSCLARWTGCEDNKMTMFGWRC